MYERQAFRPPGRNIGERQRVQVAALDVSTTVGHQVRFQKAGSDLFSLGERADRDLLLQQRFRSGSGETTLTTFALGVQQAIRCCRTHGEQLAAALPGQVEMLMPLERFDKRGEKGHEAFGADPVGGIPDQEQGVLDFLPVMAFMGGLR